MVPMIHIRTWQQQQMRTPGLDDAYVHGASVAAGLWGGLQVAAAGGLSAILQGYMQSDT